MTSAGSRVHIGARVSALAGPNDVLVSSTLRDLVIGSGLEFDDRGAHQLKGVPGDWQLFAVADARRAALLAGACTASISYRPPTGCRRRASVMPSSTHRRWSATHGVQSGRRSTNSTVRSRLLGRSIVGVGQRAVVPEHASVAQTPEDTRPFVRRAGVACHRDADGSICRHPWNDFVPICRDRLEPDALRCRCRSAW